MFEANSIRCILHRLRVQLGVNMPAQANRKLLHDEGPDLAEIDLFEVYDVVLYLGIIDILQEYNLTKKIEHACKSLRYHPMSISAVDPQTYSKRFISFLEKVFPEQVWGGKAYSCITHRFILVSCKAVNQLSYLFYYYLVRLQISSIFHCLCVNTKWSWWAHMIIFVEKLCLLH